MVLVRRGRAAKNAREQGTDGHWCFDPGAIRAAVPNGHSDTDGPRVEHGPLSMMKKGTTGPARASIRFDDREARSCRHSLKRAHSRFVPSGERYEPYDASSLSLGY